MNIEDFSTELANELQKNINILHTEGFVSFNNLSLLENWVETSEGYDALTSAYDDWIVVNLNSFAENNFSDANLMDAIGPPDIENSASITDSMRINFARGCLSSADIGDDHHPSAVALDLIASSQESILGALLYQEGHGVRPELLGLFKDHEDFSNFLLENLFIPLDDEDKVSDKTLLSLWHE